MRRKSEIATGISKDIIDEIKAINLQLPVLEAEYYHSEQTLYDAFSAELFRPFHSQKITAIEITVGRHQSRSFDNILIKGY